IILRSAARSVSISGKSRGRCSVSALPPFTNKFMKSVCRLRCQLVGLAAVALLFSTTLAQAQGSNYEFNDCHFHLTNYIQEGTNIHDFVNIIGNRVGRVALFGIPLQQQWSYRVDGE